MGIKRLIQQWKENAEFLARVTRWEVIPASGGNYAGFPPYLDPRLRQALQQRGISRLYSHQADALEALQRGEHVIIVTPTASGKTLCYNLPVLNTMLADPEARAIYLFPTKALSQDQVAEMSGLLHGLKAGIKAYTYDGDTGIDLRRSIRNSGRIIVTNPDMLHTGILPHHTKWVKLFSNLKFIVIDEVHQYRGVFGSHVANVIRRLKRICAFYGSSPKFILCSATMANPRQLAENLIEEQVTGIANNGAPRPEKHFIFYNPPYVNRELGIRRSSLLETRRLAVELIKHGLQTIIFTRSRLGVEVLLTYLQSSQKPVQESGIKGYRGGYLPRERRAIEEGLRQGTVKTVVSTNALELGIDIGQLEACLINGYPGTIASSWQQAGRTGRRSGTSLAVLIANSEPLNQYIINHPDYFFTRSPERALINPDNLVILTNHLRCAAFELPFKDGENFGQAEVAEILQFLAEEQVLFYSYGSYHWMDSSFPAEDISLRSASRENVVIIDITGSGARVIGEVDRFSAPMLVHEEAIYIHGGQQYQVERLDYEEKKAYVRQVKVNYFTDAQLEADLKVLDVLKQKEETILQAWGEVRINAVVPMFKKIRFHTHENLGFGKINLPETEMHTTAFWIGFPPASLGGMNPPAIQSGLRGLSNLLPQIAALFLMGDLRDLKAVCQVKSPFTAYPTIFLYDNFPGGVGYSQELYRIYRQVLQAARQVIINCRCREGCPSCVGPDHLPEGSGKQYSLQLIEVALRE